MTDTPYSKRELDLKFTALEHRLFDDEEGFLPRIHAQTTKTNGRVSKLEKAMLVVVAVIAGMVLSKPELLKLVITLI